MTRYARGKYRRDGWGFSHELHEASRADRLRDRGWVECLLGVTDNDKGEWIHRDDCPYLCVDGLVPPDGMIEAGRKAQWPWFKPTPGDVYKILVEAARTEKG